MQAIADVLASADIHVTPVPDARVPIWDKFVYLAAFSGFTGAARLPIGAHLEIPARARDVLRRLARDRRDCKGRRRDDFSPTGSRRSQEYMANIPPTTRSSLLIDLEQGKRIEVEALQGAAVRRAAKTRRAGADHVDAVCAAEADGRTGRSSTVQITYGPRKHGSTELLFHDTFDSESQRIDVEVDQQADSKSVSLK